MMSFQPNAFHPTTTEPDPSRRRFLQATGLGLAASAGTLSWASAKAVKSKAHIVIVGAGAAGIAAATRLNRSLDGVRITIIDKRREHIYQPGLTLVATGLWQAKKVIDENARYIPSTVNWVHDQVIGFDPDINQVLTESGDAIHYDYLLVTTGLKVDYDAIEGMHPSLIGQMGIGCVYDNPDHAQRTSVAIDQFIQQGGTALFTRGPGGIKCAGAPLKVTMLVEDRLRREGRRAQAELIYNSPSEGLFSQPDMDAFLKHNFPSRDIHINWRHRLLGIEPELQRASFATPEGIQRLDYDFIHVVPPMCAPDALANSALAWQEGPYADDGHWMEVDQYTLQHPRYPNVFGAGDCVGTPVGKTAASVKAQVPVATANMINLIQGQAMTARYNGYTSCPLITGVGKGILVEFDYALNMVPSFPFISPYQEHWVPWVMKDRMLLPAYNAMLRGRI